ncbi:hypothetical protein [Motiliproteus sp. MSK22-1]|uniref:hypothetical protein n=1 Tax=Motiliproteus sp. MSK22-1 TaxID=1897630 RepID=UPI000975FA16|nr:hypothetical protein [Motiliproteus sp. MSK22-1]OMH39604.1 hypothetical protein BGP75_01785 [Motiliproteus sp. MSK22-1]
MELSSINLEMDIEKRAKELGKLKFVTATSDDTTLLYASQTYHYENSKFEYFAVRLAPLGKIVSSKSTVHTNFVSHNMPQLPNSSFSLCNNAVQIVVDKKNSKGKFGPKGQIKILEPGYGLGSYALAKVIDWLIVEHPDVAVQAGDLSEHDAVSENSQRRHRFYKGRGFHVSYSDERGNGSFWANKASELKPIFNQEKISELTYAEFATEYLKNVQKISNCEHLILNLKHHNKYLKEHTVSNYKKWLTISILINISLILFFCY